MAGDVAAQGENAALAEPVDLFCTVFARVEAPLLHGQADEFVVQPGFDENFVDAQELAALLVIFLGGFDGRKRWTKLELMGYGIHGSVGWKLI
jgi:hypothetical protein